jgi:TRAP-type C4-dicarboxylate transport system permease small subunit
MQQISIGWTSQEERHDSSLRRLSDFADRATELVLVSTAGFFTLQLVISVTSRYLFQVPIVTSIEMTRGCLEIKLLHGLIVSS